MEVDAVQAVLTVVAWGWGREVGGSGLGAGHGAVWGKGVRFTDHHHQLHQQLSCRASGDHAAAATAAGHITKIHLFHIC